MKVIKVIITVLLAIILIVVCLTTELLTIVRLTVLNPWFYETALLKAGFYETVHTSVIDKLQLNVRNQDEAIPEKYREDVYEIIDSALPKEQFEKQIGELLGDTINFIFYGVDESEIPLKQWISDLKSEILSSDLNTEIDDFDNILDVTLTQYLSNFDFTTEENNKISDVIYNFFAPNQEIKDNIDYIFFSVQDWIKWLERFIYIGFSSIVILLGFLFLIWNNKIYLVVKQSGIFLIVNSIIYILAGGVMYMIITILKLMDKVPQLIIDYTIIAQSLSNFIATLFLLIGIFLLVLGIALVLLSRVILRKKEAETILKSNNQTDNLVIENKVNEKF